MENGQLFLDRGPQNHRLFKPTGNKTVDRRENSQQLPSQHTRESYMTHQHLKLFTGASEERSGNYTKNGI
eukprot:6466833-Amphidinium_carterae.1